MQPAVGVDGGGGFLRALPVALHHLRAPDAQFTHFAQRQDVAVVVLDAGIGGRDRQADGAVVLGQGERIDAGCRRGLGQAIGFDQGHPGDLLPAFGHGTLYRHAAAQGELDRGEVDLVEAGGVEQAVEQRVDTGDGGEAGTLELLDEALHVARVGDQVVAATEFHEDQAVRGQREDVVQRQGRDDHFLARLDA